jgi:hypothetical protein
MDTSIIITVIGLLSAVVGSTWIASVVLRRKYEQEIELLKADHHRKESDTNGVEIANAKEVLKTQMEYIITPLQNEIKALRKDVRSLRRAVEKISDCPHSSDCPVRRELQNNETND